MKFDTVTFSYNYFRNKIIEYPNCYFSKIIWANEFTAKNRAAWLCEANINKLQNYIKEL